jgi:ribonuclease P protein component
MLSQAMKREGRLTKPGQYALVYDEGHAATDRWLVLKARPNQMDISRYGISVSKRLGTAVVRNRVKRIIREILRTAVFAPGWDFIIIARNPAADSNYQQLQESVTRLLRRAQIQQR